MSFALSTELLSYEEQKEIRDSFTLTEKKKHFRGAKNIKPNLMKCFNHDKNNKVVYLPFISGKLLYPHAAYSKYVQQQCGDVKDGSNNNNTDSKSGKTKTSRNKDNRNKDNRNKSNDASSDEEEDSIIDKLTQTNVEDFDNVIYNNEHYNNEIPFEFQATLKSIQETPFKQAMKKLRKKGSTLMQLPTGYGKTVLACACMCELKCVTLILYTLSTLLDSWKSSVDNFTNAGESVWIVNKKMPANVSVIISTPGKAHHIPDWMVKYIKFVVIDEAHMFCTEKRAQSIMRFCPDHVLALSATPKKTNGLDKFLTMLVGPNWVQKDEAHSLKYKVYGLYSNIELQQDYTKNGTRDWNALQDRISNSEEIHEYAYQIIKRCIDNDRKVLVISWRKDLTTNIHNYCEIQGINISNYSGKVNKYKNADCLVATLSKAGTGFDEKGGSCVDFDGKRIDTLVLLASMKDKQQLTQVCGRAARTDKTPMIIDVIHDNTLLENHWKNARKGWYKKNGDVREISDIDDIEFDVE